MRILISVAFVCLAFFTQAQFNIGVISGGDFYQRYVNPVDDTETGRSSGSAILNGNFGLKVFVGAPSFSVSVESYINSGLLALDVNEYKGLGAVSYPILAKLNFKGLSGFGVVEGAKGWSIGGGVQWSRTEVYGLSLPAQQAGVERKLFRNYVFEISYGNGTKSKIQEYFVRYGFDPVVSSNVFNIGVNTTFSIPYFKLPDFNLTPDSDESEEAIKI